MDKRRNTPSPLKSLNTNESRQSRELIAHSSYIMLKLKGKVRIMKVKKIEITKENIEVLNEAIKKCESRARTRTYSAERLLNDVLDVEKRLHNFGIPKKLWNGMGVTFGCAFNRFPSSYNGTPEATCVFVENVRGKWFFLHAERDNACRYRTDGRLYLDNMKEEVREEVKARLFLNFCEFGGNTLW